MPVLPQSDAKKLIVRRHAEWTEFRVDWTWLQDSLEGGSRYRNANYSDEGQAPVRNLLRHQRETPSPGQAQQISAGSNPNGANLEKAAQSTYDLRLARTPVPSFVNEAVDKYLSRIYRRDIKREGPDSIVAWWEDVDGRETTANEWWAETIAPLLITLGNLDILCDHPPVPEGVSLLSDADVASYALNEVRASYILPENMLWWRKDSEDCYTECLVREYHDGPEGGSLCLYRHWTTVDSVLYDKDGKSVRPDGTPDQTASVVPHPYGCVPIVRVFDRRKFRCDNTGQSRMAGVAEKQRDYYNRDSELILNDVMASSPALSGPVDFLTSGNEITIGPGWILPKFPAGNTYVGWDYVDPPKGADVSIRENLNRRRDEIDRETGQTKPAGTSGSQGGSGVVAQSGISKQLDQEDGQNTLAKLVKTLARAERKVAILALSVASNGKPDPAEIDKIDIKYPTGFNLYSASEQLTLIGTFQALLASAGTLPLTEAEMLQRALRVALDGLDDDALKPMDDEIEAHVQGLADQRERYAEGGMPRTPGIAGEQSPAPRQLMTEVIGSSQTGPGVAGLNPLQYPG